jgi:hypothetical protein
MNHIVVSDKNYRLYAGTLAECKEFARDWAIKNKRSPKIVSERSFVETKARQAGADAQQLALTAVAEHQVDGAVITKAINTLIESGETAGRTCSRKHRRTLGIAHDVSVYLLLGAGFIGGLAYVLPSYNSKPMGASKDIRKVG